MQIKERLAILDCGGQYTKVIDRRVRELGVYTEILPADAPLEELAGYGSLILSGGPQSLWAEGAPTINPALLTLGLPILAICRGMHWLNRELGGEVSHGDVAEYAIGEVELATDCPLFHGLEATRKALQSRGDVVKTLAQGLRPIAHAEGNVIGFADEQRKLYGIGFHPEVDITQHGQQMLQNFLRRVVGYQENYSLDDRIDNAIREIQEQVGKNQVIVLVSGGVDSAVTAALLLRALDPEQIFAIHVDHGFMRKDESDRICKQLETMGLRHLARENAQDLFMHTIVDVGGGKMLGPLTSLTDPEEKRQVVGSLFLTATRNAAEKLHVNPDTAFLAQGTLRPDLIESGNKDVSAGAQTIKTHHNDVELIRVIREAGRVVETNRDWHKDEVRQVARMLGLGEEIASRQPFPGPGLCVRTLCQTSFETVPAEEQAKLDAILSNTPFNGRVLPVRSVGVQGDARSYRMLAVIWGQGTEVDGEVLAATSRAITTGLHSVNRVAYVLDRKTVEGDLRAIPQSMSPEIVDILREADAITTAHLTGKAISQCFAVLVPMGIDKPHSIALRAFVTNDFMTGRAALPGSEIPQAALDTLVRKIKAGDGNTIDLVLYDITDKPPATTEWE